MLLFEDRVVIVTGGASGIGQATALAFASQGARVVIGDLDVNGGMETARILEDYGPPGLFVETDVSREADVASLVAHTKLTFKRLDYAINNAGILGGSGDLADLTEEDFDRTIGVNLKGVWLCMKYEMPQIKLSGGGVIVNVSSINGIRSAAAMPFYTASKYGVLGLTRSAALEFSRYQVRVNAVCPGAFQTAMLRQSFSSTDALRLLKNRIPLHRIGGADEIARSILWLCSDFASYVNGLALVVDGGLLAGGT